MTAAAARTLHRSATFHPRISVLIIRIHLVLPFGTIWNLVQSPKCWLYRLYMCSFIKFHQHVCSIQRICTQRRTMTDPLRCKSQDPAVDGGPSLALTRSLDTLSMALLKGLPSKMNPDIFWLCSLFSLLVSPMMPYVQSCPMMSYGSQPKKYEVLLQGTYRHARPDQPESIAQL